MPSIIFKEIINFKILYKLNTEDLFYCQINLKKETDVCSLMSIKQPELEVQYENHQAELL